MMKTSILSLTLFLLTAQATAETTTDVMAGAGEPAANPKNELPAGDHRLTDGIFVALVSAS